MEGVKGQQSSKQQLFNRKHLERYLFTFAFELGCDIPSDEIIKSIYSLLIG